MNNVYKLSPQARVIDEASQWIARLDRGLSIEEKPLLDQWLADSNQNRLALLKVGQAWDKTEVLSDLAELFPKQETATSLTPIKSMAIAASIALLALTLTFSLFELSREVSEGSNEFAVSNMEGLYKTAIGEHTSITLPDGTELELNTNTSVRVNYSTQQRLLILQQGELHVDVAHDETRPLSVIVGSQIVQAVGTAFNIELGANQSVDLVVTEGKVLVGANDSIVLTDLEVDPIQLPISSLAVSEGERVLLGQLEEKVQMIDPAEVEIQLSWREGTLVFRGESLEHAIQEISRYTPVEFVFLDENIRHLQVAGLFQTGDVDGLLTALNDSFQIESQRVDQKVLLSIR